MISLRTAFELVLVAVVLTQNRHAVRAAAAWVAARLGWRQP